MIRKRYELSSNGRGILRLKPKQEKVYLEHMSNIGYWTGTAELDREAVLELRNVLDSIMKDWFCEQEPSPQELYRKYLNPIKHPIKFYPAQVVKLDMGESLAGRATGQVMQGGVDTTHEDPDVAIYGQTTGDDVSLTPAERDYVEDTIERLRRQT